jgi:hypothetical protein
MPRRDEIAGRMAEAVVKRLSTRKVVDIRDEPAARAAIQHVVMDNLAAEDALDAEARKILLDHAKMIKDSAADYRQLLGKVKEKLAKDRGFVL